MNCTVSYNVMTINPAMNNGNVNSLPIHDVVMTRVSLIGIPVLILLGLVGNLLVIAIMRRSAFRQQPVPLYLTTLAVADTVVLLYAVIGWTYVYVIRQTMHTYACKAAFYILAVARHTSCWILVGVTTHRFLFVCFPDKQSTLYTRKGALTVCFVVPVIFCLAELLIILFTETSGGHENMMHLCSVAPLLAIVYTIVHGVLPSIILLMLNIAIVHWLKKQPAVHNTHHPVLVSSGRRITLVLVLISSVFIISSLSISSLGVTSVMLVPENQNKAKSGIMGAVEVLWLFNHSCNFYISIITARQYRAELKKIMKWATPVILINVAVGHNAAPGEMWHFADLYL